jgi:hypothetical protein
MAEHSSWVQTTNKTGGTNMDSSLLFGRILCLLLPIVIGAGLIGCTEGKKMTFDEKKFNNYLNSAEYKKAVQERFDRMQKEDEVREVAVWIGKTGLPEALERELPRYLRREFGQSLFDEESLKAADLQYVGAFPVEGKAIHYWRIPRIPHEERTDVYAYIEYGPGPNSITGRGRS